MAYNLLDLRTRVRTKIKDSSYSAATIDGFIYDAIVEIADLYTWSYFQAIDTSALVIDDNTHPLPDNHQSTTKLILLHPTNPTSHWDITRYRRSWEEFFDIYPAADTLTSSQPIYWTEYGGTLYFNCPSNLAYQLRHYYQKTPTELTDNDDVPELPQNFREAIVLGASYRCEEERDNYDIAGVLQNRFNDKVSDLIMRLANDTMTGPDVVVMPTGYRGDKE